MLLPTRYIDAQEALKVIESGNRVFVHGSAQTPVFLLHELAKQKDRLKKVELVFITVSGDIEIDKPEYEESFHINCMFVSESVRKAINEGRGDFVPVFLSDIPDLFKSGTMPIDVALVQVSPPDSRTHGDGMIHMSKFDAMVYCEDPLPEVDYGQKATETEMRIGQIIAGMIDDGSTLQMGIGTIPDSVLKCLTNHKNLGVHTEMVSDGIIPLFESDVVNNSKKRIHPNKTVTGFAVGTRKLYDYVHDNPGFAFLDIDYVNDP
ncbi:MAG: 4-hydroxybutyrate CoA-transferase, partial [Chitinophagaceae bacterium]|nr:4-hydroxybutyrate CoA-transferase [Chitinophagaceae bacterium]